MSDWNADLYRQFEDERTRPARDLLDRILLDSPARVVDLGCGPGNSTELLAQRYPGAAVTGLDTSETMLASARQRLPACRFLKADIASWSPDSPPDVIYANASIQWVGDHETLLPRLFDDLGPGGVLAVQMPDNREEPSHRLMREIAAEPRWARHIGDAASVRVRVLPLIRYYDLLAPRAATVDVWRTVYHHLMPAAGAIVTWLRSTGLRPFLDALPEQEREAFLARYEERLAEAYPAQADGRLLLAFPCIFIVAQRRADQGRS